MSSNDPTSFKVVESVQRPVSTLATAILANSNSKIINGFHRNVSASHQQNNLMMPSTYEQAQAQLPMNPLMKKLDMNSVKLFNSNQPEPQSKYSFRPVTQEGRSAIPSTSARYANAGLNMLATDEYYRGEMVSHMESTGLSRKQQQQQEVFGSKHKLVDGLEDSNSSGIEVQQRDSMADCCTDC